MHDVDQRDVGSDGRHRGVLDDLGIADAGVLRYQEGGRAHHRRGELSVRRRRHLHRAGLLRSESGAFHERDGESSGGHGVRDRRPGVDAAHRGGRHRGLGGSAAVVPEEGEGDLHEVVAGARLLENPPEEHEEEDERRRHADRHPEHALGLHPVVPHRLADGSALPPDRVRQPLQVAEEDVEHEDARDHHQGQAEGPVHRDPQHHHPQDTRGDVGRAGDPRAQRDVVLEHQQVEARRSAERGEHPVVPGDAVPGAAPPQGVGEGGEGQTEGEVEKAGLVGVDGDVDPQDFGQGEGQVRSDVELEERPREGDPDDEAPLPPGGVAGPDVDTRDEVAHFLRTDFFLRQCSPPARQIPSFPRKWESTGLTDRGCVERAGSIGRSCPARPVDHIQPRSW